MQVQYILNNSKLKCFIKYCKFLKASSQWSVNYELNMNFLSFLVLMIK